MLDFRGNMGQREEKNGQKCRLCLGQQSWAAADWLMQPKLEE